MLQKTGMSNVLYHFFYFFKINACINKIMMYSVCRVGSIEVILKKHELSILFLSIVQCFRFNFHHSKKINPIKGTRGYYEHRNS